MQGTAAELIFHAGLLVKIVLLILFAFSLVSWAIIAYKWYYFRLATTESESFVKASKSGDLKDLVNTARTLQASPLANVFRSVYAEAAHAHTKEEARRLLRRYEALETVKLHASLTFLATAGSTAPFIGLLGTVWGIMNAFRGIAATGSASLDVIAPGIAEALITTAAGLAVAIPGVVAYNYYLSRARRLTVEMEDFSEELLGIFAKRSA